MINRNSPGSPFELKQKYCSSTDKKSFISLSRNAISRILSRQDKRWILIVGPCSIHDSKSCIEYAKKLKKLSEHVKDTFFIVMRFYFEKPRTRHGWKGIKYDPHLDGSHDIAKGLEITRELLLKIADLKLPVGSELLDPTTIHFYEDLISWGCIGARTAESQIHRELASYVNMPIAFKNNTDGNTDIAINGIRVARSSHHFLTMNEFGKFETVCTTGNQNTHLVLRGGQNGPNFDSNSVHVVQKALEKSNLPPTLMIDCSHGNCTQDFQRQKDVFHSATKQIMQGNQHIAGMVLESHINEGRQKLGLPQELKYAVSLTDPCLNWKSTEELILSSYEKLAPLSNAEKDCLDAPKGSEISEPIQSSLTYAEYEKELISG